MKNVADSVEGLTLCNSALVIKSSLLSGSLVPDIFHIMGTFTIAVCNF